MAILFMNALVLPMTECGDGARYFTANVGVEGNRITMIDRAGNRTADFCRRNADVEIVEASGKILMPGLINLHTHVAMTLMRSFADDISLMPWLFDHIWPFESKLTADDVAVGARLGMVEMLMGGTTSFVDMYWYEHAVARTAREMGMRAVLTPSFVDARMEEFERELPLTLQETEGCDRLSVRVAPHAPYSCSKQNLLRGVELCRKYNIGAHIHLSETDDEIKTIREKYGCTPTEFIDSLGYFDHPTIAAHCVKLTPHDVEILREKHVSAAHNPQSNMKLSSGVAPVWKLICEGVNVGLGTDGTCSNNDLDMWDEMRSAAFLQKVSGTDPCVMPAYEVLKMATVYGARAIGKEGELGIVAEGALADIILIDTDKPYYHPMNDVVSTLLYCGKAADVETVVVDGVIKVRGHKVKDVDTESLYAMIDRRVGEIKARK